ncbi:MAG: chromosome segregation protein SMC, partial [Halioglobus sp.]
QQAAMEDGQEGANQWLAARDISDRDRLLDTMEVEDGWQQAVETVLGDYLQAVCVDDLGSLGAYVSDLEQGVLTLVQPAAEQSLSPDYLASKVRSGGRAAALLAGVRAAETLDAALAQRSGLAPHESIITRDGIWVGANWLRVARVGDQEGGVIRRREELAQLQQALTEGQAREEQLARELAACESALKELEAERQQSQNQLQTATRRHAEISSELSAHQAKVEQINMRRERLDKEMMDARAQFAQEQDAIGVARTVLAEAIENMESDSKRREELLFSRDQIRGTLDSARQKARHDKDAAHQAAMRHQSLDTQVRSMRESIERTDRQVLQLQERRDTLSQSATENEAPLAGLQSELEKQLELRLAAEGELSEARQQVAEVEHQLREAEQQRAAIEQRIETARNALEQKRISSQTLQVQRETIHKQLVEDEHDVQDVLASLPEEATEAEWQVSLERVANRIARLGPINLAAIDEYEQQSERKNYLDVQHEDLSTALETLESAIRKIDRETRNRFRDTFEQVNSGLQELFPRVFGGGSAYLEMTGDDLLDTGIAIMARPPGKKNSTIHLLSGGEKALTAIALVFSIFQLNPAPFCILDEVDAPLDDANTGRYARLVKEMSEKVQFIYITHNKISMEAADQLMGVTMHEPGVSRLVSVDVEEAAELAAS